MVNEVLIGVSYEGMNEDFDLTGFIRAFGDYLRKEFEPRSYYQRMALSGVDINRHYFSFTQVAGGRVAGLIKCVSSNNKGKGEFVIKIGANGKIFSCTETSLRRGLVDLLKEKQVRVML